jgi:hypothetical protein
MLPILAFRIQELAHGGLTPETETKLREITASLIRPGQNDTITDLHAASALRFQRDEIRFAGSSDAAFSRKLAAFEAPMLRNGRLMTSLE